jgi:hypothetical protein
VDTELLASSIDAGFAVVGWPIAERYSVERVSRLQEDAVIRAEGDPRYSYWRPGLTDICAALVGLADADDAAITEWVQEWGFVGIAGDTEASEESISAIRVWTTHLKRCRDVLTSLTDRDTTSGQRLALAEAAAGHLVAPEWAARAAGARSEIADPAWARDDAQIDLQALYALGVALDRPLRRLVRLNVWPVSQDGMLRLLPRVTAQGPLAAGYLQTLVEAARLQISWETGEARLDWRSPRRLV